MHLLLVGISHRTAPVDLRERVDFQVRGVEAALGALSGRGTTNEAVVLSTCNRVEVYAACGEVEPTRTDLVAFLGEFHAIEPAALKPHVYDLTDLDVARHLFRLHGGR